MIELSWHPGEVPAGLKVKQVYAVMFTRDGRIMLQSRAHKGGVMYSLSGGTPEDYDADMIATLRRELIEEVNTTITDDIYLLGYQKVNENNGRPEYAQVRMVALIDKIGERKEDPATGEIYNRHLLPPARAIQLLNWGEIGKTIIQEACKVFNKKMKHGKISNVEETI